jgi:hypothetical protein
LIVTIGVIVGPSVGRTPSSIALGDALGDISSVCVGAGSTVGPAFSKGVDDSNGLCDSWLGFNPPDETEGGLWTNSGIIGDGCSREGNVEIIPASDWQALNNNVSKIGQVNRFITGFDPYLPCLFINMGLHLV